ncbi:unnamed protein product [Schistocephalus solidus]|uniref:Presqualene diphosphate phosphatase n=1 Tax=Schistocephalus solidus TaxID=70667 RepID=A0A0X3PRV8_SCHSO|nr:unnamed protein product [Schistocephalus solidus]
MLPSARSIGLALEWSCHGLPWFIFSIIWLLGLFMSNFMPPPSPQFYDPYITPQPRNLHSWRAVCLFCALLFDVLVVGVLKFLVKRPRPENHQSSDMLLTVSIDDWSFPSGHSSRAAMLQWLLVWLFFDLSGYTRVLIHVWTVAVCTSRLLMRRHHLGDVIFGYCLGLFEYWLISRVEWAYWFGFLG